MTDIISSDHLETLKRGRIVKLLIIIRVKNNLQL